MLPQPFCASNSPGRKRHGHEYFPGLRPHDETSNTRILFQEQRNITYQIFHEDRIVISLHSDMTFIGAFEERIYRRRS